MPNVLLKTKWCSRCEQLKRVDEFDDDANRADGKYPYCRQCVRAYQKARRDKLKKTAPPLVEVGQKVCLRCGENKDVKEFPPASPGTTKDGRFPYCHACVNERTKESYEKDPNPFKSRASKRKAKIRGATVESVSRRKVWERDGGRCQECGDPVALNDMHLDHYVPVSKGGNHSYANCRTSCAPCNLSKHAKMPKELLCPNPGS